MGHYLNVISLHGHKWSEELLDVTKIFYLSVRSNTTSILDGPPESATFNELLGPYARTSAVLPEDHFINSEPAMMLYTEITPTRYNCFFSHCIKQTNACF